MVDFNEFMEEMLEEYHYEMLSDSFKKSIESIENNINKKRTHKKSASD